MALNLTVVEINELLALVEGRMVAVEAEQAAMPHSNQALMQDEMDLLVDLQEKLEAAASVAPANGGPAAAGENNAMGGRRRRSGRKTRKARKGRKGSRKGSRKGRKGSRKGSRRA
jgi:hypothetical protein